MTVWTFLFPVVVAVAAQTPAPQEYQVEAVFLFNFTQFIVWPATAFANEESAISICILGDDPFGNYLDETVRGEKAGNRPLVVRRYRRVEEANDCRIVFVSPSETSRLDDILAYLKDRSVLTVGNIDGFSRKGGMVRFVVDNRHVKLRINLEAVKAARLMISSKLLRIAEIVTPETGS